MCFGFPNSMIRERRASALLFLHRNKLSFWLRDGWYIFKKKSNQRKGINMAKTFYRHVDLRSRFCMTEFLEKHFRYSTMNSWNRSTSYAHNMKIYNLELSSDIEDKLLNMLACEEFRERINELCGRFGEQHNYAWQASFNGRSGGYLVLYRGGRKESGYKSYCTCCGQKNYRSVKETGNVCGRCRRPGRVDFTAPDMSIYVSPGMSVDMNTDFDDWSIEELRERARLVQEFDQLADDIVKEAMEIAENFSVEEEEIFVPATRKVLTARG